MSKILNLKVNLIKYDEIFERAKIWEKKAGYNYETEAELIADYILVGEKIEHEETPYFEED